MVPYPIIPHPNADKHDPVTPSYLDPQLKLLRQWQAERLAATHKDLLNSPDFGDACRFFLSDVYGPHDFSRRDQDIMQVYHAVGRLFPPQVAKSLELVIEVNDLTLKLDEMLQKVLFSELHVTEEITPELYAEAYRRCNNYDERERQIDLLIEVGREVNRLVRKPFIGLTLRMAHLPAYLMGWSELQDFLERGYAAFKQLSDAEQFIQLLERRERQILDQIFAGVPNPFYISESRGKTR
jgi:hypothetical protein